jgi:hypothetical protein
MAGAVYSLVRQKLFFALANGCMDLEAALHRCCLENDLQAGPTMKRLQDWEEAYSAGAADIYWKRTANVFAEALWSETDFVAIDCGRQGTDEKDKCIGGILQEQHGHRKGTWVWNVTARLPGPRFPFATQGREESQESAKHRLVQCYEDMVRFYATK